MNLSNARSNEELKAHRAKAFARILDETQRDPGLNNHDHIDEATNHLIDHFNAPTKSDGHPEDGDFVFIMGSGSVGTCKETGKHQAISSTFMRGNLDGLAHYIAHIMRQDPTVANIMFHAMHAYHRGR